MKLLFHLQKNKFFWYLVLLCTVFSLLRLPSLIEPYWYGDEGIYEVIGQSMNHGRLLYHDVWDNKPPLLYAIYAFANGDQATVKLISLIFGLFTVIAFFAFAYKLFGKSKTTMVITGVFTFLFATPLLEGNIANAENFTLLFIITAGMLIYQLTEKNYWTNTKRDMRLFVGLLLGIGFIFKIVTVFDFIAFAFFLLLLELPPKLSVASVKKIIAPYLVMLTPLLFGFLTPFFIAIISFASLHDLREFVQAAFFGNVDYVVYLNTLFGIPQGLLMLKLLLLFVGIILIFIRRTHFSKISLFVITWLLFSLFDAFFSGRPYTHYVLVVLPSLCLLLGIGLTNRNKRIKYSYLLSILVIVVVIAFQFMFYPIKAFLYYPNVITYLSGKEDLTTYRSFFDVKAPRDYEVATFIKRNTKPSDTVYIWGDNAQIYTLAGKLPPTKYVDSYHLLQNNVSVKETQLAVENAKPKYIITLNEAPPLPFKLPLYIMLYSIPGATIYERHI
ncbi:MAG: ArnT family glycosyltransferase [Candidatus Levyibacteriota bacterium]